jgi:iron complex transport system ATP-binding protein
VNGKVPREPLHVRKSIGDESTGNEGTPVGKNTVVKGRDLYFSYGGDPILIGLSLDVYGGEILGVLGPNGSGKTTLLKNLLLYLKPKNGSITYYNGSSGELSEAELTSGAIAKLSSLVPQRSGGGGSLTVFEMVMLGRLPHLKSRWSGFSDLDHEMVEGVMEWLGILRFRDRPCLNLSGGEFQKVLLARALAQDTEILFLDEATANLDMHHAVEIMDLVRDRAGRGKTVIAVMHDLNLAAAYCDRVLLMKKGTVHYQGTPKQVYSPEVIRDIFGMDLYLSEDEEGVPFVLPRVSKLNKRGQSPRQKECCFNGHQ